MAESCALDVADRGPHTLETVARLVALTRERVRQLERAAFQRALEKHPDLELELPQESARHPLAVAMDEEATNPFRSGDA